MAESTTSLMNQATDMHPEVSVVISAYQVTAYIHEALDSVFCQDFRDLEVIVVNDGCPDTAALERVLEPYRERIVYVRQENGGVSAARNAGIRVARGKWLAFLDADDVWLPNYLEQQLAVLTADPTVDMVFPNSIIFGKTAYAGRLTMEFAPAEGEISFLRVLRGDVTVGYSALVRRELVLQAGMFDTDLRGSEDFNLWLRILKAGGKIVAQRKVLYKYRRRDESLTATSNGAWMTARILESLKRAEERIPMSPEEHAALGSHRHKIQHEIALGLAKSSLEKREWTGAAQHYREANALKPSLKLGIIVVLLKICPGLLHLLFTWRERRNHTRLALGQL